MRILIDGMNLALEQGTGVATYARTLAACIRLNGHALDILYGRDMPAHPDPALREALFFDARPAPRRSRLRALAEFAAGLRPARPVEIPATGHVLRRGAEDRAPPGATILNHANLFLKAQAKFSAGLGLLEVEPPAPVDIAHWTYPIPIRVRGARNLYTLHDLVPLKLPYATLDVKTRYRRLMDALLAQGDGIVTVSDTSRADILGLLGAPPERVFVTGQPADLPADLLEGGEAAARRGVEGFAALSGAAGPRIEPFGYFLFVGAIEPKKNLARLIEAHAAAGAAPPLVVVGRRAWQHEAVSAMIERAPQVIWLDHLPRRQLVMLMRGARALLFPSLYEGFGLPVLEAFLCGAPVVTSRQGATAEVAGGAALLVDPYDVASIRDAIASLDGPDWPQRRAEWAAKGHARAVHYDIARVAARVEAAYRAALGGAPQSAA